MSVVDSELLLHGLEFFREENYARQDELICHSGQEDEHCGYHFVITVGCAFAFGFMGLEVFAGCSFVFPVKLLLGIIICTLIVGAAERLTN